MGMITGNPKIAISVALLFALEAIAEIKVKAIENPRLPKNTATKNWLASLTGLPATKTKKCKAQQTKQ